MHMLTGILTCFRRPQGESLRYSDPVRAIFLAGIPEHRFPKHLGFCARYGRQSFFALLLVLYLTCCNRM